MNHWNNLSNIRREYGQLSLSEDNVHLCPFVQFKQWFSDVLNTEKNDPTSMVLSTVDSQGYPDSRVVLLKGIEEEAFVFYTNYQSKKSLQIQQNPHVALNFYWPSLARQVRIRGKIDKISSAESDAYFASRPFASQCSTVISRQSSTINSRSELEHALNELIANSQQETIMRPIHWGGYQVIPDEIEFWQGRDSRLHDRIDYYREQGQWRHRRLAP
jgi:pyridoxamine 5'-phosphate oxidase